MPRDPSVAERIERELALRILRGEVAPDTRLPSVRSLAAEFQVTVPTIQRAIAGLGTRGLVTAVQGSGLRVHDPEAALDPVLLPLWFEALADQPARAARMLGDFLELRRVVAGHLVQTRLSRLQGALHELAEPARVIFESSDPQELAAADLALTQAFARASGSFAVTAVLSAVARLPEEVPVLAEAFYGHRPAHLAAIEAIMDALAESDPPTAARQVRAAMATWDRQSVTRFQALLEAARHR